MARVERDIVGLTAAVSVAEERGPDAWSDGVLETLVSAGNDDAVQIFLQLKVTDERLGRMLDAVDARKVSGRGLGRLIYGARATGISDRSLVRLVGVVRQHDSAESALEILDQWLDHNSPAVGLGELGYDLANAVLHSEPTVMGEHLVERLVGSSLLDAEQLRRLWAGRIRHIDSLVNDLDRVLIAAALKADPLAMKAEVIRYVREEAAAPSPVGMFLSKDLPLLSITAAAVDIDQLWMELAA